MGFIRVCTHVEFFHRAADHTFQYYMGYLQGVGRAAAFPQAAIYLRCKSWLILDVSSGRGAEQAAASKLISQQKQHLAFTFLWKTVISSV